MENLLFSVIMQNNFARWRIMKFYPEKQKKKFSKTSHHTVVDICGSGKNGSKNVFSIGCGINLLQTSRVNAKCQLFDFTKE